MIATHIVQRVAVEGLWVAEKGDIGRLRMMGVGEVPEADRKSVV